MARKRKFIAKNVRKRKLYLSLLLVCILMIGLGYANLVSNLNINGSLSIWKYDHTLYGVLEKAARRGTYAAKYTGEHQDSYAGTGTRDIYHWYATSNANGTAIQDMNNVIFAGHCWQMIRTTDTGGVKLIYNGEVENNQCLNTRGNHVGYGTRTTQSMSTTYYYGTSYEYDSANNVFSLSGTVTTGSINTGQYTCRATTGNETCETLYYVDNLSSGTTYYVLPLNSNSHYSQFGTLPYNHRTDSLSYAGYMYNTVYASQSKSKASEIMLSSYSLSTSYWYAHDVIWGSPTANKYNLVNPYQVSATSDYTNLVGEYTFRNSSQTYTNNYVYYIATVDGSTMYYIQLTSGYSLAYYNNTYTYGDSYVDNGNGTYTVKNSDNSNPVTIQRSDWYASYSNVGVSKYVCKNAINDTCSELWYTTSVSNTSMNYIIVTDIMYANSFEYRLDTEDNTYKYFLSNDNVSFWNRMDSTNQASLSTHHYTCWNTTGKCTNISYVYFINEGTMYYINLSNGKSVEDAKNEMLYSDDVNAINSTMKKGVDAWYAKYLGGYDSYIEDTIFCNDRSQKNSSTNGWNSNGGGLTATSNFLQFREYSTTKDLSCINETDQFSTLNIKAQLTYKVGLMTNSEMGLLNNSKVQATGQNYWLISPYYFYYYYVYNRFTSSSGVSASGNIGISYGVRPTISIKPGIEYVSGDGSMANPYVVDATPIEPESFATDSWDVIAMAARTGNTSAYHVGDSKIVNLKSGGNIRVRIANMSTPSECYNSGFSQTSCGLVLWFDIFEGHRMNPYDQYSNSPGNGSIGGWPASELRTYLNSMVDPDSIFNRLPDDLQSVIIDTTVVSGNESSSGQNYVSTDKLFLLSFHEVWETNYPDDTAYSNSRQLDIFRDNPTSAFSLMGFAGDTNQWWLRTPAGDITFYSVFFNTGNQIVNSNSSRAEAVAPAFKVG